MEKSNLLDRIRQNKAYIKRTYKMPTEKKPSLRNQNQDFLEMQKKLANLEFLTDTVTRFMTLCDDLRDISQNPPVSRKPSLQKSRPKPATPVLKEDKLPQIGGRGQARLCVAHRERGKSSDLQQSYQFKTSFNIESTTMTKDNSNLSFSTPVKDQRKKVEKLLAQRDSELFKEVRGHYKTNPSEKNLELFGDEYQTYFG